MKKGIIIFISVLTLLLMTSCAADNAQKNDKENPDIPLITIADSSGTEYQIVRSENASDGALACIKQLRGAITGICGTAPDITDDFEKNGVPYNEREHEIVAGNTKRTPTELTEGLLTGDYRISFDGKKIYITAGDDDALNKAITLLTTDYISDGRLALPEGLNISYEFPHALRGGTLNGTAFGNWSVASEDYRLQAEQIFASLTDLSGAYPRGSEKSITIINCEIEGWQISPDENGIRILIGDESVADMAVNYFLEDIMNQNNTKEIKVSAAADTSGNTLIDPTAKYITDTPDIIFTADGSSLTGKIITNKLAIMNLWNYSPFLTEHDTSFFSEKFPFVDYMQFMTATGGEASRDLFKDPNNNEVLDDYDFSPLVTACRNVLAQGTLKPFIKTGNIPLKYSSKTPVLGTFGVNIFEPKDYDVYHAYIAALAQTLVDEFGLNEVQTWKWGVFTEYENSDWFNVGTPDASAAAYCKIYDYTVDALQSVLGEEIFIGAHSMTCAEGLWDEKLFIRHCASGTNYCTGKTGTRICYLSSSFYDTTPYKAAGITVVESVNILKKAAAECGLTGLQFGVDEGRILNGADELPLTSRVTGHTSQAAYDARLIKDMIDNDIDYFATWCYLTGSVFEGLRTVSYHVADRFGHMVGSRMMETTVTSNIDKRDNVIPDIVASYNETEDKVYVMAYPFRRNMLNADMQDTRIELNLPMFDGGVKVTRYLVDDSANFFDEWYSVNKDNSNSTGWSVDSAQIIMPFNPSDYEQYSHLVPSVGYTALNENKLTLEVSLQTSSVVFYVIEKDVR